MTPSHIQRFLAASDALPRPIAEWRFHLWVIVLLAASSIIPFVHYSFLDAAIYLTRAPLTPGHFLILRWFGQLSVWLPAAVGAYWLLAFRLAWLRSPGAVTTLAILLCVFLGFYAWYCAAVLNFDIHLRGGR
jgi:hypothetical protein